MSLPDAFSGWRRDGEGRIVASTHGGQVYFGRYTGDCSGGLEAVTHEEWALWHAGAAPWAWRLERLRELQHAP